MSRAFTIFMFVACAAVANAGDTVRIKVTGTTAIGFFPPFSQKELDNDDGGISEGTAHVGFALEDLTRCLSVLKPTTRFERTRALVIVDGSTEHSYRFPADWDKSAGIILVSPGRTPRVVYASGGPSSLQWIALDAAAEYFEVAACKKE